MQERRADTTRRDGRDGVGDLPGADVAEWIAHADRLAPLINGLEYYSILRKALIAARQQIFIIGWDLHSEIDLLRGDDAHRAVAEEDWPIRLADLLDRLVEERSELQIRLLIWAGASLFAFERQHLPRMKRPWSSHPRIELVWDRDTPKLGSQHQKMVVVDDRLAFAGGMDLTRGRWDTHAHEPGDHRRRQPGLLPSYGNPYHDLMIAVDGEAAGRLGTWARERWQRATGESLGAPDESSEEASDVWPDELTPAFRDQQVAMVLSQPEHAGRPEKRQVEQSYLAQLRAARHLIFIESQYFTVDDLAAVLVDRLREPEGPEVVLILPYGCPGGLQSLAMDPRRDELLDRLREAAPADRLCVAWPTLAGGATDDVFEQSVYVHAKTLVIDDRVLRIGSSNFNNRSMGLDLELDLFFGVDETDEDARSAVAHYRRRLLANLLDATPEEVDSAERESGSVVAAIEALRGGEKTLHPFDHRADAPIHAIDLPIELADPSRPLSDLDADRVLALIESETPLRERWAAQRDRVIGGLRQWKGVILLGAAVVALTLAWRYTPLADWADVAVVRVWIEQARGSLTGTAIVIAIFVGLATAGFPVTVLIAAVAATLGAAQATLISLAGVIGSSSLGLLIGRFTRPDALSTPGRVSRVIRRFEKRGVVGMAILRNVPIAPFALVNVGCGTLGLSAWRFLLGTAIGMAPGILLVSLLGQEVGEWLADPDLYGVLRVLGVAAIIVAIALSAERVLRRLGWLAEADSADAETR